MTLAAAAFVPVAARSARADAPATVAGDLVLDGVTIVDTRTGALAPNMAVVVSGGRIAQILRAPVAVGASTRLVEAQGKFVVPGFNDLHAHPLGDPDPSSSLIMLLVNGVTGVRQMSGSPEMLMDRKNGKLPSAGAAPEILAMPGAIFTRQNAPTPEAGVAEVDRQKTEGADFIKVVDVSPSTFFAVGAEAKKVGLPFEGHLPNGVDAVKAAAAGYRSIEHLGPFDTLLISCSTDEDAIRASVARLPVASIPSFIPGFMVRKIVRAAISEPLLARVKSDPTTISRLQHVVDTFSEAKCRKVVQELSASGTWQAPTLIRDRTMDFGDDPVYRNDPNLRYVASPTREFWFGLAQRYSTTITPSDKATLSQFWNLQLKLLKLLDQSNTPMMAGSDLGGQWEIPGFSLHQEFDLLAQNGIAPLKVLQMTTLNGARFFGREASMGTVEQGKNANLVLLDANPMESVQNLHRIDGVVRAGTYYSRHDLDAMKQMVEQRLASGALDAQSEAIPGGDSR